MIELMILRSIRFSKEVMNNAFHAVLRCSDAFVEKWKLPIQILSNRFQHCYHPSEAQPGYEFPIAALTRVN
jgi:hypothetical protein